ncbi:MAG TPA: hypothetical protein VFE47_03010 [Tepidisphaeraceae bacterium]|jgi:prepilin-type processing-associated H-X9-DG protein|nr:hypothetical protein [Tepidisphaeraceae bacterium]
MNFQWAKLRAGLVVLAAVIGMCCIGGPLARRAMAVPPHPPAEAILSDIHDMFQELSKTVGGLSKEQQAKVDAMEKDIAAKLKAKPDVEPSESDVLLQFRAILTDAQKVKFDKFLNDARARAAEALTSSNLKLMFGAVTIYANEHANAMPPDLGTMLSATFTPKNCLVGNSKTAIPADLASQDIKKQAAWVNAHAEFAYLGAGKNQTKVDGGFVLAYVKAPGARTNFLFADGSVYVYDQAVAAKLIADVKAGKNPPPSRPPL